MKKPLLLFTALLVTAITTAQTLRLAVYQYADNPRIKNLQPLADHLQKTLGVQTTVKSYPTVHAFIQGIQNGETDLAFINTFGYLLLEAGKRQYPMIPVLALTVPNAQDNYKTAFLSRKGSAINLCIGQNKSRARVYECIAEPAINHEAECQVYPGADLQRAPAAALYLEPESF